MLNKINIAVLGGDDRYIHVMNSIAKHGANITTVGYLPEHEEGGNLTNSAIENVPFTKINALLLPVEGMDAQGRIRSHYTDEEIYLTADILKTTPENCTIYTRTANDTLRTIAKEANRTLVVLFERDDIAIANSVPTAEAILQIAMEQTVRTIHGSDVLIIGYGRIGKTIARLFHQVGANVTVAARKDSDIARIKEMSYKGVYVNDIANSLATNDIIINTVQAPILQADELSVIRNSALIIDVASKPGGTDFDVAQDLGIHAIHALGLPGKVAPTTAGDIIADVLHTLLQRQLD